MFICNNYFCDYAELIFLDVLSCCPSNFIYDDVSVIFWAICFIEFVVCHLRTEAVSFQNTVIVLSISDDAKRHC